MIESYQPTAFLVDPAGSSPLIAAVVWIQDTLLGTVATVIAIICVASVGLLMLTGRLDLRRGFTVVLGCFLLFGAAGLVAGVRNTASAGYMNPSREPPPPVVAPLPANAASYDPYAGASVIRR